MIQKINIGEENEWKLLLFFIIRQTIILGIFFFYFFIILIFIESIPIQCQRVFLIHHQQRRHQQKLKELELKHDFCYECSPP